MITLDVDVESLTIMKLLWTKKVKCFNLYRHCYHIGPDYCITHRLR